MLNPRARGQLTTSSSDIKDAASKLLSSLSRDVVADLFLRVTKVPVADGLLVGEQSGEHNEDRFSHSAIRFAMCLVKNRQQKIPHKR